MQYRRVECVPPAPMVVYVGELPAGCPDILCPYCALTIAPLPETHCSTSQLKLAVVACRQ